jgi:3-methyladenine DNA glycosylase/8-oxoguanine DNA glycosylase
MRASSPRQSSAGRSISIGSHLDDAEVHAHLTRIKGIGAWTANVYLLMVLRRPDAFPAGDIALLTAAQRAKRLRKRPSPERLERLAEPGGRGGRLPRVCCGTLSQRKLRAPRSS